METYIKQKRATPGMVQASDLQLLRPMSGTTTSMSSSAISPGIRVNSEREMHAYDGPMQFMMSSNDPDQLTTDPTIPTQAGTYTFPYQIVVEKKKKIVNATEPIANHYYICLRRFS